VTRPVAWEVKLSDWMYLGTLAWLGALWTSPDDEDGTLQAGIQWLSHG
jgi:hypothetical protein